MTVAAPVSDSDLRQCGGGGLIVALSGGLDSCVLLHALAALPTARARGLRALHVHHGLHAQADAWSMHCQVLCDALDVSLRIARVEVDRDSGTGIEAAARHARHGAFEAELGTDQVLVLAHHRDDQAETFLLRALRASGADGLGAMRRRRTFGRGRLWRPLLDHPRTALLEYAQAHGLRWIDDPTNADPSLDRNFLRHRVLPLLRERWPQADAAFAVSAALCAEAATLLADEDAHALAGVRSVDPNALDVDRLQALPRPRRARVLRRWIETLALPPLPAQGVARIEHDLLAAAPDSDAAFAWSGAVVRRWRDILHADWRREPLPKDWTSGWDGRAPLALPDGGELTLEGTAGFDEPVRVHAREGGERIVLPGRGHTHALKHALQDLGVPPWERTRLPLLSSHDTLLAAGDLLYSAVFDAWLRARGARLVWAPASAPTA